MSSFTSPPTTTAISLILLSLLLLTFLSSSSTVLERGHKVGGRKEVRDVGSNQEVQALGGFAVEEYNRSLEAEEGRPRLLHFSRVVEAQTQVVSGIKYYLKVAVSGGGRYDAVVVVKPWAGSRDLVSFVPEV